MSFRGTGSRLRSVSAVRDFPLGCGRNVPRVDVLPQEYTPIKVCGIRDFPPFCGRNVPAPTEEDRARINSRKSLVVTQNNGTESLVPQEVVKDITVAGTSRGKRCVDGEKLEAKDRCGSTQMSELVKIDGRSRCHDARSRVREALRFFHSAYWKIQQDEEARSRNGDQTEEKSVKRIDIMAAKIVKAEGKEVNTDKILGAVPGVEVGDDFKYRSELTIVGVHRLPQGGIDYIKRHDGTKLAVSIVASGDYGDKLDNADVLVYSGQGGLPTGKDKQPEDQKLEKGNLALKNSIAAENHVRVIRKSKETNAYVYDGLYKVKRYWPEAGPHGKRVYKFELRRVGGQPVCPTVR